MIGIKEIDPVPVTIRECEYCGWPDRELREDYYRRIGRVFPNDIRTMSHHIIGVHPDKVLEILTGLLYMWPTSQFVKEPR
jgi:hypothetical protein